MSHSGSNSLASFIFCTLARNSGSTYYCRDYDFTSCELLAKFKDPGLRYFGELAPDLNKRLFVIPHNNHATIATSV